MSVYRLCRKSPHAVWERLEPDCGLQFTPQTQKPTQFLRRSHHNLSHCRGAEAPPAFPSKVMKVLLAHNRYCWPGGEDEVFSREKELLRREGNEILEYTRDNSEFAENGILDKIRVGLQ